MDEPLIVSTEPPPMPRDERCPNPTCTAGPERRGPSGGFGQPTMVCTKCGHDYGVPWEE
jgi:hypothetical protein